MYFNAKIKKNQRREAMSLKYLYQFLICLGYSSLFVLFIYIIVVKVKDKLEERKKKTQCQGGNK